ncbi:Protein of unknown function [Weissella confusa LBAE C39-2]|nr:Protein of unknown function [Weissella confusa LBAE C39-2]
MIEEVDD